MRIVVADDHSSQRAGRVSWLATVPGVDVAGMEFEQALALGTGWRDVDIAVLDCHDKRSTDRRAAAAQAAGTDPLPAHDKFAGVRVAELIRSSAVGTATKIIMISAFARENDFLARRIQQAGVDFVFDHLEADADRDAFVTAVMSPESVVVGHAPVNWATHGYTRQPDFRTAIEAVESSPAGPMLMNDEAHKHNRALQHSLRTLRKDLGKWLPRPVSRSGPRHHEGPSKKWLSNQFQRIFGTDLPSDPR